MKKIVLSVLALTCSGSSLLSQVVLQENFTNPFNFAGSGWITQNLSAPLGNPYTWSQGNSSAFNAYNGANNDYIATSFSAGSGTAQISGWLITPTVTLVDGAVLQFATRKVAANSAPDGLQIRMSTAGSGTAIPTGTASVGPFTNLMLDINPLLTTSTVSAVSSGSVNGYPVVWTIYTVQVTGVPVPTTGRFAFRYFVTNGGPDGLNSNYIGLDAVEYRLPACMPIVKSQTICAGMSTTLSAMGGASTTYSWNTGATTSSIAVNPSATTVYSLFPVDNGVPCPSPVTATITVNPNMGLTIAHAAASNTICAFTTLTLNAVAPPGTSTFAWNTGSTTPAIVVTPTASGLITYSVAALNGACTGTASIDITVQALPVLGFASTPGCLGGTVTFSFSGANNYYFLSQSMNPYTLTLSTAGATVAGTYTFVVVGRGTNECNRPGIAQFVVNPLPAITASVSKTSECVNKTVTITASGAATYSWSGAATSTNAAFTYSSATTGVKSFSVVGTSTAGCSATAVRSVTISACTGIEDAQGQLVETSFFPIPFTTELNVRGLNGRLEVYNAIGQLVISSVIDENSVLNTEELPKGVYVIKAIDNNNTVIKTQPLIKN